MSLRPPGLHPPTFDHCILIFLWETTSAHCVLVGGTVRQGALLRCQGTDTWLNLSQCNSHPAFWILNVWSKAKKGGREGKSKEERKGKRGERWEGKGRGGERTPKGPALLLRCSSILWAPHTFPSRWVCFATKELWPMPNRMTFSNHPEIQSSALVSTASPTKTWPGPQRTLPPWSPDILQRHWELLVWSKDW